MTNDSLSPAAQAVLDAYNAGFIRPVAVHHKPRIAAALRAAADEVVPVEQEPPELPFASVNDPWPSWNAKQNIRAKFLAIAAELEGGND